MNIKTFTFDATIQEVEEFLKNKEIEFISWIHEEEGFGIVYKNL